MQIWRRSLTVGDSLRDWFAVWDRDGGAGGEVWITQPGVMIRPIPFRLRPSQFYDAGLMCCYRLPPGTAAGTYDLTIGGANRGTITVGGRTRPPLVKVDAQSSVDPTNPPDTLYWRCIFDRVPVFVSGGLFVDCIWSGLAEPGLGTTHAFSTWGTKGPLGVVGGRFDGTDRGPVIRLLDSVTEPIFLGLTMTGIGHIDNGNELFCVENTGGASGTLIRPIVAGWRCYGNQGDLYIAGRTTEPLIQNVRMDRGSIVMHGDSVTGGQVESCELLRGRIVLGDSLGVRVDRCALTDPRPTAGNRGYLQKFFYDDAADPAEARKYNLPPGVTANGVSGRGNVVTACAFS